MYIMPKMKMVHYMNVDDYHCHGLYNRGNLFYATFIHGYNDGTLWVESKFSSYPTCIMTLRKDILKETGIWIPVQFPLYISPCYSYFVRQRYKNLLSLENIHIIGNWKGITSLSITDEEGYSETLVSYVRKFNLIPKSENCVLVMRPKKVKVYSFEIKYAVMGVSRQKNIKMI